MLKSRCSPKGITKMMKIIQDNDVLIRAVDETGFGSLKYLPYVKMEHAYIKQLLDNFDVDTCSILGVQIKDKDVVDILGVPDGTEEVPRSISKEDKLRFKEKFGKKSFAQLTSSLKELKRPDMQFKETFFLLAFGNFYCPSTKNEPNQDLYKALEVLQFAQNYNWGKFILEFLLEGIKEYQQRERNERERNEKRNMGIAGCTYFLKVFVLQNLNHLDVQSGRPVMSVWTTKEMKIAIRKHQEALKNPVGPHDTDEAHTVHQEDDKGKKRKAPLLLSEERVRELEETVSSRQPSFDLDAYVADPGVIFHDRPVYHEKILETLEPGCWIHEGVFSYYKSYLRRTMSFEALARSLLLDTYSYSKLATNHGKVFTKWSGWWQGRLDEYSYIFLPLCLAGHFSLAVVCFIEREDSSLISILHMDSYSYHPSLQIFDIIEWGLKQTWAGEPSDFPSIVKMIIEVPQQPNQHDCALFVIQMMRLFLEQAPERFQLDNIPMFGKNWFNPVEACESGEAVRKMIEEEIEKKRRSKEEEAESTSFDFSDFVGEPNSPHKRSEPLKCYQRHPKMMKVDCSTPHDEDKDPNVDVASFTSPAAEPSVECKELNLRGVKTTFGGVESRRSQVKYNEKQLATQHSNSYTIYKKQ